jgi:hypothetical protein
MEEEKPVRFMGLDLSLRGAGIVVLDEAGIMLFQQVIGVDLERSASVRNKIERLITIAKAIVDAVAAQGAVTWNVAIENFAFHQHGAIADLGEINGVVKMQLWMAFGIEPVLIGASTARKLVLGKGNIKKKMIIPALAVRGLTFGDHNIADAYVMAEALRRRTFNVGGEEKPRARRTRTGSKPGGRRGKQPCGDTQTSLGIA